MKFNRCLIMFFLAFSLDGIANETEIVTKINQVLPAGMSVKGIKQSQVDGLFVVDIGDLQPIYASKDGNFFLYGEMYAIKNGELLNTTKQEISLNRRAILDSELLEKDFITFAATDEKHVITVFTDVDCGYCRKFHGEIEDYNAQGITVNYVAFPRSGLESDSYNKIVNVNKANNQFDKRRENQLAYWLEEEVRNKILLKLSSEKETSELLEREVRRIIGGETGFYVASKVIIDRFLSKK